MILQYSIVICLSATHLKYLCIALRMTFLRQYRSNADAAGLHPGLAGTD